MKRILVTGASGQLGLCIKDVSKKHQNLDFFFKNSKELDVSNFEKVFQNFKNGNFDYCINCAAYTNVDKAETEIELVEQTNVTGVEYLAQACKKYNVVMIHISTDFVFDGKLSRPYIEGDIAKPLGVYGKTKLASEMVVKSVLLDYFVIRTSWLYSEYGNNFLKTILRLSKEQGNISVVCDQIGASTYAGDLAQVILKIIVEENKNFGTYHYSNEGVISWYDFGKAIFEEREVNVNLLPIKSENYPTLARRPAYSVMNKSKIKKNLNIKIPSWKESLIKCLKNLK